MPSPDTDGSPLAIDGGTRASTPSPAVVREHLAAVLSSPLLAGAERLSRLLRFIVEETLQGRAAQLKEMRIGLDVFGRKAAAYDPAAPADERIAVLPIVNMSPDGEAQYFCDGLTDELIAHLAQIPHLRVVARTSSFQFKGAARDIREVGRLLDVSTVLEGSVRTSGNRIRVTVQLINVADGCHIWSERYERDLGDIFAIHEHISASVSGRCSGRCSERAPRSASAGTASRRTTSTYRADFTGRSGPRRDCGPRSTTSVERRRSIRRSRDRSRESRIAI